MFRRKNHKEAKAQRALDNDPFGLPITTDEFQFDEALIEKELNKLLAEEQDEERSKTPRRQEAKVYFLHNRLYLLLFTHVIFSWH